MEIRGMLDKQLDLGKFLAIFHPRAIRAWLESRDDGRMAILDDKSLAS